MCSFLVQCLWSSTLAEHQRNVVLDEKSPHIRDETNKAATRTMLIICSILRLLLPSFWKCHLGLRRLSELLSLQWPHTQKCGAACYVVMTPLMP